MAMELGRGMVDGAVLAAVDWEAAVAGLDAGRLPCSSSEEQMLRLAASIAGGVRLDLGSVLSGLDLRNAWLVAAAVLHACGHPDSGLEADEVPSGFALNTATSDPNDYTYNAGTMVSSESKEFDWVMNAKDLGLQQVEISVTSTSPKVLSETQIHPFTVAEAPPLPEADLAINASLPPVEGFNQDIDPGKPGLQLYPGDKVYYRLTVTNHGPDSVSWLVNSAIWPEASLAGVDQWGGAPSERTMTMFVDEPDGNTRYNSDLYDPDGDIALASGETATMFWQTAVQDWAGEGPVTVQFKTGDGGNGYIVDPSMGNNDSTAEFEVVYPTQAA